MAGPTTARPVRGRSTAVVTSRPSSSIRTETTSRLSSTRRAQTPEDARFPTGPAGSPYEEALEREDEMLGIKRQNQFDKVKDAVREAVSYADEIARDERLRT